MKDKQLFIKALTINLLNPVNIVWWLGLFSLPPGSGFNYNGKWVFGLAALFSVFISELGVSWGASKIKQYLTDERIRHLDLVLGLLFWAWWMLKADFPSTHALVDDWYNHAKYFLVFIAGFLLARQDLWWQQLVLNRRLWLGLALLCYSLIIAERQDVFDYYSGPTKSETLHNMLFGSVLVLNHWLWLLAVLGYAGAYLAKTNSPLLRYCNDAVLPWYILHQTLIILFAAWLKPLAIPAVAEFPLLLVLTVAGCWLGYELIRRVALLRWCFGLGKARQMKENSVSSELLPASDPVR